MDTSILQKHVLFLKYMQINYLYRTMYVNDISIIHCFVLPLLWWILSFFFNLGLVSGRWLIQEYINHIFLCKKKFLGNEFASIPLFSSLEEEISEDWRYKREEQLVTLYLSSYLTLDLHQMVKVSCINQYGSKWCSRIFLRIL